MIRFALTAAIAATPAFADAQGYGHMTDWNGGYGAGMMFGPVLWIIVLGLVVAGVIWMVRRFDHGAAQQGKSTAMTELDLRLARGEIEAEDYTARKKLLGA